MNNETYLTKAISSIIMLAIFWTAFAFIFKSNFGRKYTLENIIGTIEFVSMIALVLLVVILISRLLGNLILGFFVSVIVLLIVCAKLDALQSVNNISNATVNYIFLAVGIIFNIVMIVRIITGFQNYSLCKKSENLYD